MKLSSLYWYFCHVSIRKRPHT